MDKTSDIQSLAYTFATVKNDSFSVADLERIAALDFVHTVEDFCAAALALSDLRRAKK